MYKHVLFDLDGTLTDPALGITSAVAYALRHWGIETEDLSTLNCFIGPPLYDSFELYYGFSREDAVRAVDFYREYYSKTGLFQNKVYEGIPELLQALKASGRSVILATSKPEFFARQILEHFKLDSYFDFIGGATMDSSRVKKGDVIAYALQSAGIDDPSAAVMVGDRKHDIIGAQENGMDSIGVLFGYGNREEMIQAGATHIAENVSDIFPLV